MRVTAIYFSPTGNTKKSVEAMAAALDPDYKILDITVLQEPVSREFAEEELVIIGMPVYGGRIPAAAAPRLEGLCGHSTPCILAATYGNRHYDDALAEMEDIAVRQGFVVWGAAALVGRHTYGSIQTERPDPADLEADAEFARKAVAGKGLKSVIPGKRPYKEGMSGGHFKPLTLDTCVGCGVCRRGCPVGAIDEKFQVVADACISCFRCIRNCPVHAKHMNVEAYQTFAEEFSRKLAARRENEYFL